MPSEKDKQDSEELSREDFDFLNTTIDTFNGPKKPADLCGWAGTDHPEVLREAFDFLGSEFPQLRIIGATGPIQGARSMLWEVSRKVLGSDTPNYPQESGDCVSFGGKNAGEYLQFYPIINGVRNMFKRLFPPYLYGTGRVQIGKGRLGRGAGSLGIWQAKAVMEYGIIPIDTPGCPSYSGRLADSWGYSGPPKEFITVGKEYLIKSAALVKTWDDVVLALTNGYPVTIASNVGFTMNAQKDGFHRRSGSWAHQMCIIGVNNEDNEPYACILNSWGDSHGQVIDFQTKEPWPKGTLRVRRADIERILSEGDSFAYSSFDGFPAQELPRDFFSFL